MKPLAWNSIISNLLSPLGVLGRNDCSANWHVHVFASLWTCLRWHARPCSFTSLFHYTCTALFRQRPENRPQCQQMTTLRLANRATPLHACVNTVPTSTDRSLICHGNASLFPLWTALSPFRWRDSESMKLVCHTNQKQFLELQVCWVKGKWCVRKVKRQKILSQDSTDTVFILEISWRAIAARISLLSLCGSILNQED